MFSRNFLFFTRFFFSRGFSRKSALAKRGNLAYPAGAQEDRQPTVFHPLVNLPFSLLPWVQTVDCVSRKRTRQSGYLSVSFSAFSQFTDSVLLHRRVTQRRARHDSAAHHFYLCRLSKSCDYSGFAPAHGLRGPVMPRLREVADLCSSNVSDTANRLRKTRKKKFSAVPLFRSGHMSAICARPSKGKG